MLASSTFKQGLAAGVPEGVIVAHKFGERVEYFVDRATGIEQSHISQLHDCGIVYYKKTPYGICVMTEGQDLDTLKTVISMISKTTYDEVDDGLLQNLPE
jgi:hypothetical protein